MARATFGGRGDEIFGLILVIGGLLAGLSVYLDKAGVLGRLLDGGLGWSVGATRAVLPVAMLGTGLTMFRERSEFGEISKRLPNGLLMAILSVTGLLHMGRGRPGLDDGVDGLGEAGGLIGLGVGGGLEAAVAPRLVGPGEAEFRNRLTIDLIERAEAIFGLVAAVEGPVGLD